MSHVFFDKVSMRRDSGPEFDPDQILRDLRARWDRFRGGVGQGGFTSDINLVPIVAGVLAALVLVWLATGSYTVGPQEQAAVRLFGQFRGLEGPGLHWYPPAPIGTRNIERVLETKTLELGFRSQPPQDVQVESQMITGDLNIVDVHMVVQYRITNLRNFLFNISDPGDADRDTREGRPDGRTLRDATEAALRQVVGQRGIDDALTIGREAVQEDTKRVLQATLDQYGAGIEVLQVVLQNVRPPDPVRAAFDDVVRARVDK